MKDLGFMDLLSLGLGGVVIDEDADPRDAPALGWSVRRQILGGTVVNDADDTVGIIDDVLVSTTAAVIFAIIDVSAFVASAGRRVAIPVTRIDPRVDGSFLLPGATKAKIASFTPFVESTRA